MRRKQRKKRSKLTFEKWLRSLSNEIIANLAGQWRKDFQRTRAIQGEYNRRLKAERAGQSEGITKGKRDVKLTSQKARELV